MTVWYLCNTETFQQCSDRFNVTKSTCHRIITKIIEFLVRKSGQYIVWPTDQQLQKIKSEFYKMHGINGVVGAIDGSHIKIKRPASKHHYVYYNRKGDYSLLIQGVCDYKKKFISFFCGEPGSIHDSRLLKKSSLYRKVIDGFLGLNFLLGDSAYPCFDWLICPFKDNGNLTENQKIFNYRHSATRIVIENAFGLLKGRFRRLKYFENDNLKFVVKCIVAAAVLHNICLDNQDDDEFDVDVNDNNDENMTDVAGISGINEKNSRRDEIFATMFI
ncbi:Protein ANTAGONIST OF LIKE HETEROCHROMATIN PROTEIN 1 [Formica fusca]